LRSVADARGVKAATLIHAVRVAMTGTTVSPGLFDVVALIGRARTRVRLRSALRLITPSHA
jgi:glutamyl-tRNA synthetase